MIPSDLSDFNVYGGLYRYLNLVYVPEAYVSRVHINPQITGKKTGSVHLEIETEKKANLNSNIPIKDARNELVYE